MSNEMDERPLINRSSEEDRRDLKNEIRVESKKIWRVAFPGMWSRITSFSLIVITQSFMGHISELDLAAYALVQTLILRFGNAIILGMSSATETLCGQAFGGGRSYMMGIYLQRSWIVDFVTGTLLLPLFIFTKPIFTLLNETNSLLEESGKISLWFIPIMYSFVFSMTFQMYLQAQLKNMLVAWLSTLAVIVHLILSWLFVIKLNLGVPGAMGSFIVSSWLVASGEFVYVLGGWCPLSWKGFSTAAFHDLWPMIKLSVSSAIMLCLELWYNSILVLVAGYMKNAEIAISAFSICLNVSTWQFNLCLGFLGAACVRVSNELGRGDAKAAKFAIKVVMSTSIMLGLISCIMCIIFGRDIAYIFTNNDEVADTVSELSVLLAFTMFFNSIQSVLTGAAIGAGLQSRVAVINLFCYYVIGVPLGVALAYLSDFGIQGLWIGMIAGVVVQVVSLGLMTWKTDWDQQVKKASERLNQWSLRPTTENKSLTNHEINCEVLQGKKRIN